jgi:hypothetical protein
MNTKEIKLLIHKYYEGETTLDEEKILKSYFSSGEVDAQFSEHIPVFEYFKQDSLKKTSAGFDEKFLRSIEGARVLPFYKQKKFLYYFTGVAASLIFIVTLIFESGVYTSRGDAFADTSYSRQETQAAYEQTKKALAYVSGKYAQGVEPLGDVAKFGMSTFTVNELVKFGDGLNNINNQVNKMNTGVDNLSKLSKFTIIVKP